MTTTAQSIIKQAQTLLKDLGGIRWPATDLMDALNAGQRDIAVLRPDMMATAAALALSDGARQQVPANCAKLIDIPRNTVGQAIRQVGRDDLDAVAPDWYSRPGALTIKHFTHDPREPNFFYVFPPAATGASVQIVYSALPVDLAAPGGAAYGTVTGNIAVPDLFANALLHFVLFRAYAVDSEGGNAALSGENYTLYKGLLSDELTTRQAVKPSIATKAD